MTKTKWVVILMVTLLSGVVLAAKEQVDKYGGGFPVYFSKGMYVSNGSVDSTGTTANRVSRLLSASATIDFTATTVGRTESSAITVTGARVGDSCTVGDDATAGALKADFSCYVSAANAVKVRFMPKDFAKAQVALVSGTPSTQTVTVSAGSICTCTPVGATAVIAAAGCATGVSSTTLTLTGPNTVTTTVTYDCAAPVDPASATYYVYVRSAQ